MLSNLRAFGLCLLLTLVALVGCGGHRSGGSHAATDTIVFNNGRVATVGDDAKDADEAKLDAVFGASWTADQSALAHQIVATMQTLPDFREGGIAADGTAWGVYADGTETIYFTNDPRPAAASPALSRTASRSETQTGASAARSIAHAKDLPEKSVAYVFSALEAQRSTGVSSIAEGLTNAGYSVRSAPGSLDDWRGLSGAGVLVNNSHGATANGKYYVQTSDVPSAALNDKYRLEIAQVSVARGTSDVIDDSPQGYHTEKHYVFNRKFLEQGSGYATMFGKNSLFVNLSCSGASSPASFFFKSLFDNAGLGVYGGWSDSVLSNDTLELGAFFFDRALGLNQITPVDPSLPAPASVSSIESTLSTASHEDGNPGPMNHSSVTEGGKTVAVKFSLFKAKTQSLTTLIPSATSAKLTPDGTNVEIKGDFGADQGTVTVAGKRLTVVSWSSSKIVAVKPDATDKVFVTSPTGLIGNSVPIAGSLLRITPNKPTVALGSTTTFTVATELGSFPTGAKFTWTVKGTGTVGGAGSTTTTVPHIDYVAPKQATTDTLTVSVKDAKGESLGNGGTNVDVGDAATVSLTISGNWERYNSEGGLGVVPNNGTYNFADGIGVRYDPQVTDEPANFELISIDYANFDNGDGTESPGISLYLRVSKGEAVKEGFAYPLLKAGSAGFDLDTYSIGLQTPFLSSDLAACFIPRDATGSLTFTNIRQASDGTTTANYTANYSNPTGGVLKATGVAKWKYYDASKGERRRTGVLRSGRVAH